MQNIRTFALGQLNAELRTVEATLSSETPIFRQGLGNEVLIHTQEAVDLSRAPLPLITSHDHQTTPVGVVERLHLAGRKLRGTLRFGTSQRATELWEDVQSGIVRSLSIGYSVLDYTQEGDTYRVTSWQPYEASIVSVPADNTVGIGRSFQKENTMNENETNAAALSRSQRRAEARADNSRLEQVRDIIEIGRQYKANDLAAQAVSDGASVEDFKEALLNRMSTKPMNTSDTWGSLSSREQRTFSITRAILAQADPAYGIKHAGLERAVSEALAAERGKPARGILIPPDAFRMKRDLNVGTTTAGGHLVQTDVMGDQFIDILRARSLVMELGARVIAGLSGSVAIPRKTSTTTGEWVNEGSSATESNPAFDQVTLAPKSVTGFIDITRKLLIQGSLDVEMLVRNDLAEALATAIDSAAINGSGTAPTPRGILNTSGIGNVAGGTNGAAPTWANIVALETEVANANADLGALGYLTNSKVRGKLKTTEKVATTGMFVWSDNATAPLNGHHAAVSNNVPSNLVKGTSGAVASAIIFGNFADLIIGLWSGVDLLVDPYSMSSSGGVRVVAFQDADIVIRQAKSFAAMLDALTA